MDDESEIIDPFDIDEDLEGPKKLKHSWFFKTVGLLIIAGLIYVTGIRQALFYHRTPLGTPQENIESLLDAETIIVPVRVFVFRNDDSLGSHRTSEDISQIIENASQIWAQADIELKTENTVIVEATDEEIRLFFDNPYAFASDIEGYSPDAINVFFSRSLRSLRGINGIAFPGVGIIAVADFTTTYDFRVLAHEIGHILGLPHIEESKSRLMYTGASGTDLTEDEVLDARSEANATLDNHINITND